MTPVREKADFYGRIGLDYARGRLFGRLTPETALAISKLHDVLAVSETMEEGSMPYVTLEIPLGMEASFEEAFRPKPLSK